MEIILQGKYAHTANMLLKQLKTKEITLEEFSMQCAYWGLKTLDDIYFRSLPGRPISVVEYEQLSYTKRNRLTQEYYEDNPGVLMYYEERDRIMRMNKTDLIHIEEYKKDIPESDVKAHKRLDKRINDFKIKMEGI
jgi:hypothetical protein